jgi:hypothetical protein
MSAIRVLGHTNPQSTLIVPICTHIYNICRGHRVSGM